MTKKISSCVIIYDKVKGTVVSAHPTGRPWKNKDGSTKTGVFSLPKGELDEGEDKFAAAIREIKEETGLDLEKSKLKFLGHYDYIEYKSLYMFFYPMEDVDLKKLKCDSYFEAPNGKMLPEMNGFANLNLETELNMFFYSLQKVIKKCLEDWPEYFSKEELLKERQMSSYFDFYFCQLQEAYKTKNLSYLDDIFSQLYDIYSKRKVKTNILGMISSQEIFFIKSLFIKHNIKIDFDFNDKTKNRKEEIILNAGYPALSKNKNRHIEVLFNQHFFDIFKKGNEDQRNKILIELKDIIAHEDTHYQQEYNEKGYYNKDKVKKNYKRLVNNSFSDPANDPYFFQESELSGYARGETEKLLSLGLTKEEILEKITSNEGTKELIKIAQSINRNSYIKKYFDNRERFPQFWKLFRRRMYDYLIFNNSESIKETFENIYRRTLND